jgi:hypothetical protein
MNIQNGRPSNRPYGTLRGPVNAPNNRAPTRRSARRAAGYADFAGRPLMIILCWSRAGGTRECRGHRVGTRGGTWRGRQAGRDRGPAAAHADRIQGGGAQAGAGHGDVAEILRGGDHELMRGTAEAGRHRVPADRGWRPSLRLRPGGQAARARWYPAARAASSRWSAQPPGSGLGAVRAAGGQRGLAGDRAGERLDDGTGRGSAASAGVPAVSRGRMGRRGAGPHTGSGSPCSRRTRPNR